MFKRNRSWELTGVSQDARDAAARAAGVAGISMGAWLATIVEDVSAQELGRDAAETVPPEPQLRGPSLIERAMTATPVDGRPNGGEPEPELEFDTPEGDEAALMSPNGEDAGEPMSAVDLDRLLDDFDRRVSDRLEPLRNAVDRLSERLDDVDDRLRDGAAGSRAG